MFWGQYAKPQPFNPEAWKEGRFKEPHWPILQRKVSVLEEGMKANRKERRPEDNTQQQP
jgi:hypothetical protein